MTILSGGSETQSARLLEEVGRLLEGLKLVGTLVVIGRTAELDRAGVILLDGLLVVTCGFPVKVVGFLVGEVVGTLPLSLFGDDVDLADDAVKELFGDVLPTDVCLLVDTCGFVLTDVDLVLRFGPDDGVRNLQSSFSEFTFVRIFLNNSHCLRLGLKITEHI